MAEFITPHWFCSNRLATIAVWALTFSLSSAYRDNTYTKILEHCNSRDYAAFLQLRIPYTRSGDARQAVDVWVRSANAYLRLSEMESALRDISTARSALTKLDDTDRAWNEALTMIQEAEVHVALSNPDRAKQVHIEARKIRSGARMPKLGNTLFSEARCRFV